MTKGAQAPWYFHYNTAIKIMQYLTLAISLAALAISLLALKNAIQNTKRK